MSTKDTPNMIFVVGLQRSGTTFIARALAQHSGTTGLTNTGLRQDEGQFLQNVFPNDHVMGRQISGLNSAAHFWSFHPDAHLTEADVTRFADARARIDAAWAPFWGDPSAPYRVEKSPSSILRMRFLQALYPGARFVVVRRHPIEQALAITKWAVPRQQYFWSFPLMFDHWLNVMETYAGDRDSIEFVTDWRCEDLLREPESSFQSMFDSLGLSDERPVFEAVRDSQSNYRQAWRWLNHQEAELPQQFERSRPRGKFIMNSYRNLLGPAAVSHWKRKYEDRFNAWGYSFDDFNEA